MHASIFRPFRTLETILDFIHFSITSHPMCFIAFILFILAYFAAMLEIFLERIMYKKLSSLNEEEIRNYYKKTSLAILVPLTPAILLETIGCIIITANGDKRGINVLITMYGVALLLLLFLYLRKKGKLPREPKHPFREEWPKQEKD